MLAAVLENPQKFLLQETGSPGINENEILIKVSGCGICASSIPVWEGREWFRYPMEPGAPGHEGWGVVAEIGDGVDDIQAGDAVTFLSYHAYAEFDKAALGSYVKLPGTFKDQPFPGEPLACAMNILHRSDIQKGEVVAIIGIGFLGALLCQLAKAKGAAVIAISRRPYALGFAHKFGADEVIPLTSTWEVKNTVAEITGKQFCPRVIEATGKQAAIDIATDIVAEGGKIIIAGYHQDGMRQVNFQQWNWKGIDVINAHERDPAKYFTGMQEAVDAVNDGIIQPDLLYTDVLPLSDIDKGFERTKNHPDGVMKVLIKM